MRIKENPQHDCTCYSLILQEEVRKVFQYAFEVTEIKALLEKIKKESLALRGLFWREEEVKDRRQIINFFDARMQATVYYTLKNLEGYQQYRWKELVDEGEKKNDGVK
ncbi:hypothetical protein [Clostridium formicaceticum]|uniref:Uncharacterized protein n=1 Tax=Clostridium formicaceticum TaxID=1497 RepID=A0AAC9RPB5_9CLOT|nr:hypothetical protein [Clostridium formicaceticum]AOY78157.1 hypothetical protein BJL90_21200 [Clostridium formicaceticum]ARE88810.1 hypothetical protein CLFO_32160 [Clostridium formicaceticum]